MFITNLKRIIKTGFINFCRNGIVSISAVLVMIVTLFTVIILILSNVLLDSAFNHIKNKIDINVYATTIALPEEVLALKESLEFLPEVDRVEYVSREQALANFKERHRHDELTLQALNELGENPLGAILNIKAKEISQYAGIANFLESEIILTEGEASIIERVNYYQNKIAIDKLNKIINAVNSCGFALAIILIMVSTLITFNTIRLAIYISREEIKVMRLVGANNNYIRGPFIFEGVIYGVISTFTTMILFYPILFWLNPFIENIFFIDLLTYYSSHLLQIFAITVAISVFLGIIASILAVRKYLKI